MDTAMIRIGHPLVTWLHDSDAGTWFCAVDANIPAAQRGPIPHDDELMDVLAKIHHATARADGSVRIEVCAGPEARHLRDWAGHIEWISRENAGDDATERGRYNSARATRRALDRHFGGVE